MNIKNLILNKFKLLAYPPDPITKEEYESLSDFEKKNIRFINPSFEYDKNYNYRIVL